MSKSNSKNLYVLIPKSSLPLDKPVDFDVYVPIGDRFVKVISSGQPLDQERIDRYIEKKNDVLYIESRFIERFLDEKFAYLFEEATDLSLEFEFRARKILRALELCLLDIRLVRPSPDKFMRIRIVIDAIYQIYKMPTQRSLFLKNANQFEFNRIVRRSILGSLICMALVIEQNEGIPLLMFSSLFQGSLYRDLKSDLIHDRDPHDIESQLTSDQRTHFKQHPAMAIAELRNFNVLDDVMETMIIQHHENPNGKGFPVGLKRMEIYLPAQFLFLSDLLLSFLDAFKANSDSKSELEVALEAEMPPEYARHRPFLLRTILKLTSGQV